MNEFDAIITQLAASGVLVPLLQWAKRSKLVPWLTMETAKLNRLVAVLWATITTVGIHASFDSVTGTLTINGLGDLVKHPLHFAVYFVAQIAMQQNFYRLSTVGDLFKALNQIGANWPPKQKGA